MEKNIDEYDLLLDFLGYHNLSLGITEEMIFEHDEVIANLAKEIGININQDLYALFIEDDKIHSTNEATIAILELSMQYGLDNNLEEAEGFMHEAHFTGESHLTSGFYKRMKQMKEVLIRKGFSSYIKITEK